MSDDPEQPGFAARQRARAKIARAREVTAEIDRSLWPAIEQLQRVGQVGNGAGVYADDIAFKRALIKARTAISEALKMAATVQWPTPEDYDAA